MIKVENIDVWGFEHAIRGMRNPMNSWSLSDSVFGRDNRCKSIYQSCGKCRYYMRTNYCDLFRIGPNDLDLMQRLYKAGTEHRKYLRQIMVSLDITAPLYWWKEFDTYKVGTVSDSCSTMHKIAAKEFTLEDFSHEHLSDKTTDAYFGENFMCITPLETLENLIKVLNMYRRVYLAEHDKDDWWNMIQLLPSSYNQKRTITMNYENVMSMIKQREAHKLDEWRNFVAVLKELPYIKEIMEG